MTTKSTRHATPADTTAAVDAFLATLVHPCTDIVQAVRESILRAAREIAEGIKWNAPSYRTHEYFATTNLREKEGIGIILHLGAKVRDVDPGGLAIEDPASLLTWLARDRACVRFKNMREFVARQAAFEALIRQWIRHV